MTSSARTDDSLEPEDVHAFDALPPQVGLGPVGQGTVAAGAALVGAAYPPAAAFLSGVGAFLPALGQRLSRVQNEKTEEVIAGAVAASALTAEDVVRQLVERDDLALITADALDAARRTRLPGKPAALGQSLGSILADDAKIDEESIWVRLLRTVEPPHKRVLGLLLAPAGIDRWIPGRPLTIRELGLRLDLGEAVTPLIQDLIQCGFVASTGIDGGSVNGSGPLDQSIQAMGLAPQLFERLTNLSPHRPING